MSSPNLRMYPIEKEVAVCKNNEAASTVGRCARQPRCPPIGEWLDNLGYNYTVKRTSWIRYLLPRDLAICST